MFIGGKMDGEFGLMRRLPRRLRLLAMTMTARSVYSVQSVVKRFGAGALVLLSRLRGNDQGRGVLWHSGLMLLF